MEPTKLLIAGQEYDSTQEPIRVYYPWDQKTLVGICFTLDFTQMNGVIQKAQQGYEAFRHSKLEERAAILAQLAQRLVQERDTLAKLITLESGKPLDLSRVEVNRAISVALGYSKWLLETEQEPEYETEGFRTTVKRFAHGPVFAITPFNFPLNLVMHKLAPAIASGTSITIKPSSKTPLTCLFLGMLTIMSGYNHITVIPCRSSVAESLIQTGTFKKLSFTGSTDVGWYLKTLAPKAHWTLELGSNSACIVDDVELGADAIALRCVLSAFQFAGQSCISLQRLYVPRHLAETMLDSLARATEKIVLRNPMNESVDLGSLIDEGACHRVNQWVEDAKNSGARCIVGGSSINEVTYQPTILYNVNPSLDLVQHEAFAPVFSVIPYDTLGEALQYVNDSNYGLHASIFTSNPAKLQMAYNALDVGGVIHNNIPSLRIDEMPYGGVKDSGMGREGVICGVNEMTYPKTLIKQIG